MADESSGGPGGAPDEELPQLDFSIFVLGIHQSALIHLGLSQEAGSNERDFELARQDIDLLILLHQKTKGNLTGDEERTLDRALIDVKSRYAELTKDGLKER